LFYPALATYKVDLFNRLAQELNFKVVLLQRKIPYHHELNQNALLSRLTCDVEFMSGGLVVAGRDFRPGIWKTISRFRPQVVVTHEFSFATAAALAYRDLLGHREIGYAINTAESTGILAERRGVRDFLCRAFSRTADSMLMYTDEMKQAYIDRGIAAEKMFVCANHQDEQSFLAQLETGRPLVEQTIHQYGLAGKKVLLCVGRLVPLKGIDRLIRAFAASCGQDDNAVLALVGDGPEQVALQSLAASEGVGERVLFLGHREGAEKFVWYLVSGALGLASDRETYGAVVNEAMIAGMPVACSTYAGARTLIRPGINGWLFDPYDVAALTEILKQAVSQAPVADVAGGTTRRNLMPVKFERDVESFLAAVEYAYDRAKSGRGLRRRTAIGTESACSNR